MKKNTLILVTILCLSIQTISKSVPTEGGPIASEGKRWNFEISNKAIVPIVVTLKNYNGIIFKETWVSEGGKLRAALDNQTIISSDLKLIIRHGHNIMAKEFTASLMTPCVKKSAKGNCLNTVFLTFECPTTFFSSARLRPQRGLLRGLAGISESGVSLKHNIRSNQMKTELGN